jgi:signal peptidase I
MNAAPQAEQQKFSLGEAVRLIVGYAVGLFLLYAFLVQPFYIPSGSMKGTLLVGDRLIVTKFSYGYSEYSLPFQPISFSGRYFATPPERGDVVVFRAELDDTESDFIKRIVGLPGDTIQMINGALYLNGQAVNREAVPDYVGEDACAGATTTVVTRVRQWRETLPNGVSYNTLDCMAEGPLDNTPPIIVPAGHYFMMGDNRDNSTDSRVPEPDGFGAIPFENILGRAQIILFSIAEGEPGWQFWRWPWTVRWNRLLALVR